MIVDGTERKYCQFPTADYMLEGTTDHDSVLTVETIVKKPEKIASTFEPPSMAAVIPPCTLGRGPPHKPSAVGQ